MKNLALLAVAVFSFAGGANLSQAAPKFTVTNHSFSKPDVVVKHIDLNLNVDFTQKKFVGTASLHIESSPKSKLLILDSNTLTIKKVTLDNETTAGKFTLGEPQKFVGQALAIDIKPETKIVHIEYETSPAAMGVQWLEPSQTEGKKMPFVFTQSQAILARTWMPCQDTPQIRMTYNARLQVPKGMMAIMSAENKTTRSADGVYSFKMPQAVPSYLFALAAGDIDFVAINQRAGVYAEPTMVKKAAWEFADLGKMMDIAESIYGPYRWGRYDVLVLPPSFPFGGMENPRLTFLSPTLIAGDRSQVRVVTHELAHSWSGNLVTNATWDDFWLNEGFTNYFERRIIEKLYGTEIFGMNALIAMQELDTTIHDKEIISADKHLKLNLKDRNPDDGMTEIAYEKGSFFLLAIEEAVGRETWDAFLKNYFNEHAFKSVTTEQFLAYLDKELIKGDKNLRNKLQIFAWVHSAELPSNMPKVHTDGFSKVDAELKRWAEKTPAKELQTKGWITNQWIRFLNNLPTPISTEQLADLDKTYGFTKSGNSEILTAWFMHTIRNGYKPADAALEAFLVKVGRRKYLKPLYSELAKTPQGLEQGRKIYAMARPGYHTIATNTIDGLLKYENSAK